MSAAPKQLDERQSHVLAIAKITADGGAAIELLTDKHRVNRQTLDAALRAYHTAVDAHTETERALVTVQRQIQSDIARHQAALKSSASPEIGRLRASLVRRLERPERTVALWRLGASGQQVEYSNRSGVTEFCRQLEIAIQQCDALMYAAVADVQAALAAIESAVEAASTGCHELRDADGQPDPGPRGHGAGSSGAADF